MYHKFSYTEPELSEMKWPPAKKKRETGRKERHYPVNKHVYYVLNINYVYIIIYVHIYIYIVCLKL